MSSHNISIVEVARKAEQALSSVAIPSPRLDAEVLLAYVLEADRSWLIAHGEEELESEQVKKFESLVARRLNREPVAYITGVKEFYGREFAVTPDVLIPRPETEDLVELFFELGSKEVRKLGSQKAGSRQQAAGRKSQGASEPDTTSAIHLQHETALLHTQDNPEAIPWSENIHLASEKKQNLLDARNNNERNMHVGRTYMHTDTGEGRVIRVVDVGCGSGCVGITLKSELPELDVTLADISPAALKIAKQNADTLDAGVHCVQSDLLSNFLTSRLPDFDVIVANLPYVDTSWERSPETDHEPALALFADDSGLELIKRLIEQSATALTSNGLLLLEADPCQHEDIVLHGKLHGFDHAHTLNYAVALQKLA